MDLAQFQLHAEIEQSHWWFCARRQIMLALAEAIVPPSLETTAIDIGCGTGGNLAVLAGKYRALGIDASPDAVAFARKRFPGLDLRTGFAPEGLGVEMEKADLVTLMDVLEHVEDDAGMLGNLVHAAHKGCHFLITVPADPALWSPHDEAFGHLRRYDRASFEQLWAGLPVEVRLVSYFNRRLLPLIRLVRLWGRRSGRSAGRGGTDFWMPNRLVNFALTRIFAGERHRLLGLLSGRQSEGYSCGASLVAILRRE